MSSNLQQNPALSTETGKCLEYLLNRIEASMDREWVGKRIVRAEVYELEGLSRLIIEELTENSKDFYFYYKIWEAIGEFCQGN